MHARQRMLLAQGSVSCLHIHTHISSNANEWHLAKAWWLSSGNGVRGRYRGQNTTHFAQDQCGHGPHPRSWAIFPEPRLPRLDALWRLLPCVHIYATLGKTMLPWTHRMRNASHTRSRGQKTNSELLAQKPNFWRIIGREHSELLSYLVGVSQSWRIGALQCMV